MFVIAEAGRHRAQVSRLRYGFRRKSVPLSQRLEATTRPAAACMPRTENEPGPKARTAQSLLNRLRGRSMEAAESAPRARKRAGVSGWERCAVANKTGANRLKLGRDQFRHIEANCYGTTPVKARRFAKGLSGNN
jgi:hypothetical protein